MRPIFCRFWLLTIISLLLTLSIGIVNPQPSFARSWMDLLFRGVQVIQLATISPQQEVALGRQINQGLLESGKIKLAKDARINQYVQEIGQRLAATSDHPEIPYTFQVVRDNSINTLSGCHKHGTSINGLKLVLNFILFSKLFIQGVISLTDLYKVASCCVF